MTAFAAVAKRSMVWTPTRLFSASIKRGLVYHSSSRAMRLNLSATRFLGPGIYTGIMVALSSSKRSNSCTSLFCTNADLLCNAVIV